MDTLTAIQTRRAVKHFRNNEQLPAADLDSLLQAAHPTPTSFNIQHVSCVSATSAAPANPQRGVGIRHR